MTLALSAIGIGTWQQLFPAWSPFAAFGIILLYGFLRANYEEYLAVEGERDALLEGVETEAKRAAIGKRLSALYHEGVDLRAAIVNSTDETTVSECDEELKGWREKVIDYLVENASTGKAQYVDGVTSVAAVSRPGMKSNATRPQKEPIVSHLDERLKRLAEVVREY